MSTFTITKLGRGYQLIVNKDVFHWRKTRGVWYGSNGGQKIAASQGSIEYSLLQDGIVKLTKNYDLHCKGVLKALYLVGMPREVAELIWNLRGPPPRDWSVTIGY